MTTSLSRGIESVRFFRLCSRAPPILMNSLLTGQNFALNLIGKPTTKILRKQKVSCRAGKICALGQQDEPVKSYRAEGAAGLRTVVEEVERAVGGADQRAVRNDVAERAPAWRRERRRPLDFKQIVRRREPREQRTVDRGDIRRSDAAHGHGVGLQ